MLRLQDVSLMRGVRVLYSHATLLANPGERIGLVGSLAKTAAGNRVCWPQFWVRCPLKRVRSVRLL